MNWVILTFIYSITALLIDPIYIGAQTPSPIDSNVYSNLFTYAHLLDISYCITPQGGIESPFKCNLKCDSRFPNMTLIYQWYFEDSVAGYIAVTQRNLFGGGEEEDNKKKIIVSLRGTKNLVDTYTDLKIDMIGYSNLGKELPFCGHKCRVHKGFHDYYSRTLSIIHQYIAEEIDDDDYELIILGHSLGGSVALLLGLHYLDLGYKNLQVVTMGQPLLGNEPFVDWVDQVMGSAYPTQDNSRKYLRVVHKKDIITVIPSTSITESYTQFNNLIYINCSSSDTHPTPQQVVDCIFGNNPECIVGDFDIFDNPLSRHYYLQTHITYFRKMGFCGRLPS